MYIPQTPICSLSCYTMLAGLSLSLFHTLSHSHSHFLSLSLSLSVASIFCHSISTYILRILIQIFLLLKNPVSWDMAPCRSCVKRRFGEKYRLHLYCRKIPERGTNLQPPAHVSSSLADFSTLQMEAIRSAETSVYTISSRRQIPEDGILQQV
jgi:hypothetical protein